VQEQDDTAPDAPTVSEPLDRTLLRLSVLTTLQGRVSEAVDATRATVHAALKKGATEPVTHPDDETRAIATVSKSKPKAVATVTSPTQLDAWILANYPAKTERRTKILGSEADVIAVLREHAEYLLDEVVEVPAWARNELATKSAAVGEPMGFGGETGEHAPPGIHVSTPDGQLRVRLAATAIEVVDDLWLSKRVDLDGNLLELPAGGAE
jgi:hypothetical protein